MGKKTTAFFSLGMIMTILFFADMSIPAFAEVTSIITDQKTFDEKDEISFSGTVGDADTGIVSILIQDSFGGFVHLLLAPINPDSSFQKTMSLEKNPLSHGNYHYVGFIQNMSEGKTGGFAVSLDGMEIHDKTTDSHKIPQNQSVEIPKAHELASFVDTKKDPKHYVDRYYGEKEYRSWFDRNYPGLSIEEAVGYTGNPALEGPVNQNIPFNNHNDKGSNVPYQKHLSSMGPDTASLDFSEITKLLSALSGMCILFGIVYLIRKKISCLYKHISFCYGMLSKKIISVLLEDDPRQILQVRLARGEITLNEYLKIDSALK